ncbi:zinc finger MYM-type protein 1-like [Salvia divinorum]|uniref:Zinc finger MYM-type protein 1-like n=1 Tax=Salvia divinorum TaxID=28513 RepID=A0ABD1FUC4_SALDI
MAEDVIFLSSNSLIRRQFQSHLNMERYVKRCRSGSSSSSNVTTGFEIVEIKPRGEVKLNLDEIVSDPGLRKPVYEFDVGVRDESIVIARGKELYVVSELFSSVSMIVNTTGALCKMPDQLKQSEHERLVKEFDGGEAEGNLHQSSPITIIIMCRSFVRLLIRLSKR